MVRKIFITLFLFFFLSISQNTIAQDASLLQPFQTPENLKFKFSKVNKKKFNQNHQSGNKTRVNAELFISESTQPIKVDIHLRGLSTLKFCQRKSYTVRLYGENVLPLIQGSASREFLLISMCHDQDYLLTYSLYSLWQSLNLFPLRFGLTNLILDDETKGLYMIVERPENALPHNLANVASVVRRGLSHPLETYTVHYSKTNESIASADIVNSLLELNSLSGAKFEEKLKKRIDIEQFLTHLAVAVLLQNGDYIDEIWFIQRLINLTQPDSAQYQIMKWDPDAAFQSCHHFGRYAYNDPWEIAYCVESSLAKRILQNPTLYQQFVDRIKWLIQHDFDPERIRQKFNQSAEQISKYITSNKIANAMLEGFTINNDSVDLQQAHLLIKQRANKLAAIYKQWIVVLDQRIMRYQQSLFIQQPHLH